MKVNLFPFQKTALARLRQNTAVALGNYQSTHTPQIVSYTAPTGAGKTIIVAALIEAIFNGDENFPDQNDAIFVWLSDSPQLNEQSRLKIETKADKCYNRCETITDDSFDREILEDGRIYFLNTQKLSKSSNLTKHSDLRQHTIWETFANTAREKSNRLYFIIDEAHRGAQRNAELARATTIMQKFLRGSTADKLPAMPVVIGMTATSQRFHRLAENTQSTTHYVSTTTDEVRASGLLKDRIVITYPETSGNDMAVLQAAADEWKNKWIHWAQYCQEQHYAYVNPIMIIQVQNAQGNRITATDLDECVRIIEERTGEHFTEGQVVHAFGEGTPPLVIHGLNVPYVEPSRIADDKRIKIVFFKETLTTGWDCPRAETMMSFRRASDYTYIAQLLGRMVRTPTQQHINVDETLNEVHLYLPQFNSETVYDVVEALRSIEGANIPTDIEAEIIGSSHYDTLTVRPTYTGKPRKHGEMVNDRLSVTEGLPLFDSDTNGGTDAQQSQADGVANGNRKEIVTGVATEQTQSVHDDGRKQQESGSSVPPLPNTKGSRASQKPESLPAGSNIDREGIVKAINDAGLLTYDVRKVRITDYLKSAFALARLFTRRRIDMDASQKLVGGIVEMIHKNVERLKASGFYEHFIEQVLQFRMSTQIFDVFGRTVDNNTVHDLLATTDADIDRQFRLAETRLGNEGIGQEYCRCYEPKSNYNACQIDVIIFAADAACMDTVQDYAKMMFHELNDKHRRDTVRLPDKDKKLYDDIVSDGDIVSKHNFRLPETICVPHENSGIAYSNHLFVDNSGTAVIHLNGWELKVIEEEQKQEDFICWLRNPSRGSWSLRIPYMQNGEYKPAYPDFLIIRKNGSEYIVDVLEPHDPSRSDLYGKAQGFAEYARQNPGMGRIQMIILKKDSVGNERPFRLDMSSSLVREKVARCANQEELHHIFNDYGFFI